jgi:DNA polymerase-3 subunit gamma/tau
LKTIEETPKHVILIFSTTEIHKIPSPILSRSQQFFFTRINNEKLKNMIRNICKNENIQIDVESVNKIVELADGSARDALTFLDQLVMFTNNNIDVKSINMLFALIDDKVKINFLNLIKKQQTEQVLNLFNEFIANGIDIVKLTMQLIDLLIQKLTYLKTKNLSLINVDVSELNLSESECLKYIDTFNNSYSKMKFSSDPNFYLKLAFFSLIEKKVEAINIKEEITEQKQTIAKPVALEKDENKLPNLKDVFNTSIINLNTKTQEEPVSTPKQKEPISVIEKNNDIELLFFQIAFNHDKKYKLMFDKIFDSIKSLDNLKLLNLTTNAIKSIICSKNGVVLQFSDELDSDLLNSKYLNHELLLEIQQY